MPEKKYITENKKNSATIKDLYELNFNNKIFPCFIILRIFDVRKDLRMLVVN